MTVQVAELPRCLHERADRIARAPPLRGTRRRWAEAPPRGDGKARPLGARARPDFPRGAHPRRPRLERRCPRPAPRRGDPISISRSTAVEGRWMRGESSFGDVVPLFPFLSPRGVSRLFRNRRFSPTRSWSAHAESASNRHSWFASPRSRPRDRVWPPVPVRRRSGRLLGSSQGCLRGGCRVRLRLVPNLDPTETRPVSSRPGPGARGCRQRHPERRAHDTVPGRQGPARSGTRRFTPSPRAPAALQGAHF